MDFLEMCLFQDHAPKCNEHILEMISHGTLVFVCYIFRNISNFLAIYSKIRFSQGAHKIYIFLIFVKLRRNTTVRNPFYKNYYMWKVRYSPKWSVTGAKVSYFKKINKRKNPSFPVDRHPVTSVTANDESS